MTERSSFDTYHSADNQEKKTFGCATCNIFSDLCEACIHYCHKGHQIIDHGQTTKFTCVCGDHSGSSIVNTTRGSVRVHHSVEGYIKTSLYPMNPHPSTLYFELAKANLYLSHAQSQPPNDLNIAFVTSGEYHDQNLSKPSPIQPYENPVGLQFSQYFDRFVDEMFMLQTNLNTLPAKLTTDIIFPAVVNPLIMFMFLHYQRLTVVSAFARHPFFPKQQSHFCSSLTSCSQSPQLSDAYVCLSCLSYSNSPHYHTQSLNPPIFDQDPAFSSISGFICPSCVQHCHLGHTVVCVGHFQYQCACFRNQNCSIFNGFSETIQNLFDNVSTTPVDQPITSSKKQENQPPYRLVTTLRYERECLRCSSNNRKVSLVDLLNTDIDLHVIFFYACAYSVLPFVNYFVSDPLFDVNTGISQPKLSISPLYIACCYGSVDVVRILLRRADLKVNCGKESTHIILNQKLVESPLHAALSRNHTDIVEAILTQKPDLHFDPHDFSPHFIPTQAISSLEHFPALNVDTVTAALLQQKGRNRSSAARSLSPSPSFFRLSPSMTPPSQPIFTRSPPSQPLLSRPAYSPNSSLLAPDPVSPIRHDFLRNQPPASLTPPNPRRIDQNTRPVSPSYIIPLSISLDSHTLPITRLVDVTCGLKLFLLKPTPQDPVLFPLPAIRFPVDVLREMDTETGKIKKPVRSSDLVQFDEHGNFVGKRVDTHIPDGYHVDLFEAIKKSKFAHDPTAASRDFVAVMKPTNVDFSFDQKVGGQIERTSCLIQPHHSLPTWLLEPSNPIRGISYSSELSRDTHLSTAFGLDTFLLSKTQTKPSLSSVFKSILSDPTESVHDDPLVSLTQSWTNPEQGADLRLSTLRFTDNFQQRKLLNIPTLPSASFVPLFSIGRDVVLSPSLSLSSASFKRPHMITEPLQIISAHIAGAVGRRLIVLTESTNPLLRAQPVLPEATQNFDGAVLGLNQGHLAGTKTDPVLLRQLNAGLTDKRQITTFPILSFFRRVTVAETSSVGKNSFESIDRAKRFTTRQRRTRVIPPDEAPTPIPEAQVLVNGDDSGVTSVSDTSDDTSSSSSSSLSSDSSSSTNVGSIFEMLMAAMNGEQQRRQEESSESVSSVQSPSEQPSPIRETSEIGVDEESEEEMKSEVDDEAHRPILNPQLMNKTRRVVALFDVRDVKETNSDSDENNEQSNQKRVRYRNYLKSLLSVPQSQEITSHSFSHKPNVPILLIPPLYTATATNNSEAIRLLRLFDSDELEAREYSQTSDEAVPVFASQRVLPPTTPHFPHVASTLAREDHSSDEISFSADSDSSEMSDHTRLKVQKYLKRFRVKERARLERISKMRELARDKAAFFNPDRYKITKKRFSFYISNSFTRPLVYSLSAGWRVQSMTILTTQSSLERDEETSESVSNTPTPLTSPDTSLHFGIRINPNECVLGATVLSLAADRQFDDCAIELLQFTSINPNKFSVDSSDTNRARELNQFVAQNSSQATLLDRIKADHASALNEENDHKLQLLLREALIGTEFVYHPAVCPPLASAVLARSEKVVEALLNDDRVLVWHPFYIEWDDKKRDFRFLTAEMLANGLGFDKISQMLENKRKEQESKEMMNDEELIETIAPNEPLLDLQNLNMGGFERSRIPPTPFNITLFLQYAKNPFTQRTFSFCLSFVHSVIVDVIDACRIDHPVVTPIVQALLTHPLIFTPLQHIHKSFLQLVLDDSEVFRQILFSNSLPLVTFVLGVLSQGRKEGEGKGRDVRVVFDTKNSKIHSHRSMKEAFLYTHSQLNEIRNLDQDREINNRLYVWDDSDIASSLSTLSSTPTTSESADDWMVFDLSHSSITSSFVSSLLSDLVTSHISDRQTYLLKLFELLQNTKWSERESNTELNWQTRDEKGRTPIHHTVTPHAPMILSFFFFLCQSQTNDTPFNFTPSREFETGRIIIQKKQVSSDWEKCIEPIPQPPIEHSSKATKLRSHSILTPIIHELRAEKGGCVHKKDTRGSFCGETPFDPLTFLNHHLFSVLESDEDKDGTAERVVLVSNPFLPYSEAEEFMMREADIKPFRTCPCLLLRSQFNASLPSNNKTHFHPITLPFHFPKPHNCPSFSILDHSGMTPLMVGLHKDIVFTKTFMLTNPCVSLTGGMNAKGVFCSPIRSLIGLSKPTEVNRIVSEAERREGLKNEDGTCELGLCDGQDLIHCLKVERKDNNHTIPLLQHLRKHLDRARALGLLNSKEATIAMEKKLININQFDSHGSILMFAVNSKDAEIVQEILKFQSLNVGYAKENGTTALSMARREGLYSIVSLLSSHSYL